MSDIFKGDVYVGLSGVDLKFDRLDIGDGLKLSKTCVHMLATYMMVFDKEPSETNKEPLRKDPDGTSWKNVTKDTEIIPDHTEYAITAELFIPGEILSNAGDERFFLMQWIVALLRIWSAPTASALIIANTPFSRTPPTQTNETVLIPFETQPRGIRLEARSGRSLTADRVEWVRKSWKPGLKLVKEHRELRLAVQALDQAHFVHDWGLGMLLIWAALEGLFSPSRSELRFRMSAMIASFLEPPGPQRRLLHNRLIKLYDARSDAAHGRLSIDRKIFFESMEILRDVVVKMISDSRIPSKDDLEASLLEGKELARRKPGD